VLLLLLGALGAAYYYFVYRPAHAVSYAVAYVLPATAPMVDTPAEVRENVGSVKSGERVEVMRRTAHWAQIRTAENVTGWVENGVLLDSETWESGQKLLHDLGDTPPLAEGHTTGIANLHLEPSRNAAQLVQLPQNVKVQIYGRRMVDRPPAEGQPPAAADAAKVRDAWYLIRTPDRAGWVLGRFVSLDVPEKLNAYAQGANMVTWQVLKTVSDNGQPVPEYLTAERVGTQEADFTHIRVFTWWIKNHEYVTAYAESNLNGYFPIRVTTIDGVPYFRLRLIDDQGQKFQKVYGLFDTLTHVVGTVPGWESDAMPEAPPSHHKAHSRRRKG
jgi:hypothetical protein